MRASLVVLVLGACAPAPATAPNSPSPTAAPSAAAPQPPPAAGSEPSIVAGLELPRLTETEVPDGPCGGFEKLPLTASEPLLANRLTIRPFQGLVNNVRPYDVMSSPHPDESETRLYIDDRGRQVAVFVEELFRRSGPAVLETVRAQDSAAKNASWFRTTTEGLTSIVLLPTALEPDHEKALVMRLYVQSADALVIRISFYVSPSVLPASKGCSRLAYRLAQTLKAGPRRLDLDGGDRDLESNLRITLPKGVALVAQPGPDFLVYHGYDVSDFAVDAGRFTLYLGGHPQPLEKGATIQAPLLGRPVKWVEQRRGTARSREAQVPVPKSRDTIHVSFGAPNETSFETLAKMASSVRTR